MTEPHVGRVAADRSSRGELLLGGFVFAALTAMAAMDRLVTPETQAIVGAGLVSVCGILSWPLATSPRHHHRYRWLRRRDGRLSPIRYAAHVLALATLAWLLVTGTNWLDAAS